ncbi:TenA family protein [Pseudonocardia xinjiangensis]|uniref:TenA family protein n=1 Tax=Pseudonocardia xinjiangensis TaxID=75289 RepID=UPI003D8EA7EF
MFSAELRQLTGTTWDAAVGHRFVTEIWRGQVPPPVLTTYLVQDHQFVDAFVALMGAAVATADRPEARIVHARQLGVVAGPENDFFARALDVLDVPLPDRTEPELLAPTVGFIELMDTARRSADYASCLTVLLVAEWVYLDWATRPDATAPDEPLQREWIELHRGSAFETWVEFLRSEFDRVATGLEPADREQVRELFTRTVDLELAFFDAAYR